MDLKTIQAAHEPYRSPTRVLQQLYNSTTGAQQKFRIQKPYKSFTGALQATYRAGGGGGGQEGDARRRRREAEEEDKEVETEARKRRASTGALQELQRSTRVLQEVYKNPTGAPHRSPTRASQELSRSFAGAVREPYRKPAGAPHWPV